MTYIGILGLKLNCCKNTLETKRIVKNVEIVKL